VLWLKRYDTAYLFDLQPTADGGFILGGGWDGYVPHGNDRLALLMNELAESS